MVLSCNKLVNTSTKPMYFVFILYAHSYMFIIKFNLYIGLNRRLIITFGIL